MTLIATLGAVNANSYVSLTDAETYFATRSASSAWAGTDPVKEAALISATVRLETLEYRGDRYDITTPQRLKWPRKNIDVDGFAYDGTTVPTLIVAATCEEAIAILASGTTDLFALTGLEQFEAVSVGPVSITMKNAGKPTVTDIVRRMLRPVLSSGGSAMKLLRA